jgi:hypothetical protein
MELNTYLERQILVEKGHLYEAWINSFFSRGTRTINKTCLWAGNLPRGINLDLL